MHSKQLYLFNNIKTLIYSALQEFRNKLEIHYAMRDWQKRLLM